MKHHLPKTFFTLKTIALMLIAVVYANFAKAQQQRPNIVLIISDDHAYQAMSAYGSKFISTPAIDRIAHEGVIFQKAYVNNSLCGPSRAAILTGKYSHINGFKDNVKSEFDYSQDSFIKRLTASGYQTAWIGKIHIGNNPQGFTYFSILPDQGDYYNPDFINMEGKREHNVGYVSNIITQKSEKWLDNRDPNKPFCLVIGHKATHRMWLPDTSDLGKFDHVKFKMPDNFYDTYDNRKAAAEQKMEIAKYMRLGIDLKMLTPEEEEKVRIIKRMTPEQKKAFNAYYQPIREAFEKQHLTGKALTEWRFQHFMQDYCSTVAGLDRNIGEVLNYLDKHKLTKNTIVIYASDQGFYLGEHGWFDKRFMYEESFRMPMVLRYPGVVKPGSVNNNMVMNIDIGPTLLDAAGVVVPKDMQGESFLPQLKNPATKGRDAIYYHYYEGGHEHNVSPHFGVKTKRYKLIRFYSQVDSWELYDLEKDPKEMHNVYGQKAYASVTANLKTQLKNLIKKYKDIEAESYL